MKFLVDENDENLRLDSYLSNLFESVSRSKIQNAIKNNFVFVNSEQKKPSYILKEKDFIEIFDTAFDEVKLKPQNIPLDIIYEDEEMLVVNKPSGMLVHPTINERSNTLVNALLYRYENNLSDINGEFRRGILHRLDRNTSGLLMVAKNNIAHEFLTNQIKEKTAIKKYLAITNGIFKEDTGVINLPIGRHKSQPHKMAVVEGARDSITEFKVLERFKDATFVELNLKTGRTHQIRVHLSYFNTPIYNDSLYGSPINKVKTQEQVLQSYKLTFTKVNSNEIINLEIEPDEKIKKVLNYLKGRK